jgi:flagellar hook-associated protein 3 FlgL
MSTISTLGQNDFIRAQIMRIQKQMDTLNNQVSSGKKAQVFSGINDVSQLSLQLNHRVSLTQSYITNIDNAKTRIKPVQAVLQRITDIANQLRNDALIGSSAAALPTAKGNAALKAEAEQALNEIASLLNTKIGNDFLFGGRDTTNPPMSNFGSASNASSILGQVASVASGLTSTTASGDNVYDAITRYLSNNVTYTTAQGGTAPAPFGYTGETGAPGGSAYSFTTSGATAINSTTVTLAQSNDLPKVGDYIEFATIPPMNGAYQVTGVAGSALTIARTPATVIGVENAIPAGTAVNVIRQPSAVTTVSVSSAQTTGLAITAAAASGATQISVASTSSYKPGDRIQISSSAGTYYSVTNVDAASGTITIAGVPGGGSLATAAAVTDTITVDHGYAPGTNLINVGSTTGVTAGMSVKFSNSNVAYTVSQVVSSTQIQVVAEGTSSGTGLSVPIFAPIAAPTLANQEVTATFGPAVTPLSATIDDQVSLNYGIRADDPALRTVLGAIFALATANLSSTTDAGFREVATRAAADLANGSRDVTTLASTLGVKEQTLQATEDRHKDFLGTLQSQLSTVEDADMTESITRLTQIQTQLQASFQLLSTLKSLSLANYI